MLMTVHMVPVVKHPLLAFREANNLNQAQAAEMVGVTQEMWSLLERRKAFASPTVAKRISEKTGVSFEVLLNFSKRESSRPVENPDATFTEIVKDTP